MAAPPSRRETLALLAATAAVGCAPASAPEDAAKGPDDTDPRGATGGGDSGGPPDDTGVADDATCAAPTSSQTAGPFYPGEPEARVDITEGIAGVALALDLEVVDRQDCAPVVGAEVDLWGADAAGRYSGYADFDTVGEDWMRGQQLTDAAGMARFTAIVPGAYPGRAVHLHVKVRPVGGAELTTQVYFPDALVAEVLGRAAYADSAAQRRNADDQFYAGDTLVEVTGDVDAGVVGRVRIVV